MIGKFHKQIEKKVKKEIETKSGIKESKWPAEMKKAIQMKINKAAVEAENTFLTSMTKSVATNEITSAVDATKLLDSRLHQTVASLTHVTNNADLKNALVEHAKLLKMKYDEMKKVGFTNDFVLQYLLAEASRPKR